MSHVSTLITLAVLLPLMHWLSPSETAQRLVHVTDVGPSAGYYGCLSALLWASPKTWRWWAVLAVGAYLVIRSGLSWWLAHTMPLSFQTDLAHLIAFIYGGVWVTLWRWMLTKPVAEDGMTVG